jgi:hypothetical protein
MSQKQKGWVGKIKDKIHTKAGDKLIELHNKYVLKNKPDEEPLDLDMFKPDSKAKGGKIVSSYYKGGKI